MKFAPFTLMAAAVLTTLVGTVRAQFITFTGNYALSGPSDVTNPGGMAAAGTSFDAFQGLLGGNYGIAKTTQTIGDTTFNAKQQGDYTGIETDGKITLSGVSGGSDGSFSSTPDSAAYDSILLGVAYTSGTASIAIGTQANPLTSGHEYQIQLFDAAGGPADNATFTAGGTAANNSIELTGKDYALGTFVANGAIENLTFTDNGSNAGVISAIAVRDLGVVPEPSTYALMGVGLAAFTFSLRRNLA